MQLARSCSGKKIMATRAAELKLRGGKRVLVTTKLCEAVGVVAICIMCVCNAIYLHACMHRC